MLNITIINENKNIEPQKIIIEVPKNDHNINNEQSQFDYQSIIEKISQLQDDHRFRSIEKTIKNHQTQLQYNLSKINEIPPDLNYRLNELNNNYDHLSNNINILEDKFNQKIHELKFETKNKIIKKDISPFIPLKVDLIQTIQIEHQENIKKEENIIPKFDVQIVLDKILSEVNLIISSNQQEQKELKKIISKFDERFDLLKYVYSSLETYFYELEKEVQKLKSNPQNIINKKDSKISLLDDFKPLYNPILSISPPSEDRIFALFHNQIQLVSISTDTSNLLIHHIQKALNISIDPIPSPPPIDPNELLIPRYDDQFRIVREALVDMRTGIQLLDRKSVV